MLGVTALELRHPLTLFILMEPGDAALDHRQSTIA